MNYINTLQNYYGMAIRPNASGVYGMKKGVGAVFSIALMTRMKRKDVNFVCEIKIGGANGGVKN